MVNGSLLLPDAPLPIVEAKDQLVIVGRLHGSDTRVHPNSPLSLERLNTVGFLTVHDHLPVSPKLILVNLGPSLNKAHLPPWAALSRTSSAWASPNGDARVMNADLNPDELASGIARAWLPVSGARLYSATTRKRAVLASCLLACGWADTPRISALKRNFASGTRFTLLPYMAGV